MTQIKFVSRGGQKLAHALDRFRLDPVGACCADLGSHVGGFVDCLLQRGAARVYSIDTSYGTLAWKLRKDARVVAVERTNALHVQLPEPVDLVTIDVGWTPQHLILPAAARMLKPDGRIISLLKPHYEADKALLARGVLPESHWQAVVDRTMQAIPSLGLQVLDSAISPMAGHGGNREILLLLSALRTPTGG